jgi:hypothetical protein
MKHSEDFIYTIDSYFEYKGNLELHTIYFYTTYLVINNDTIPYTKILKVSKYKTGLRILTVDKDFFDIPCEQDLKRQIFGLFKCLNENAEQVDPKTIIGTAILHFGGHYFIVHMRNSSYEDFRRIVLKRIAFHFYPKERNQILLEHFEEFRFFIKDQNIKIPLENSSDLGSALFHFNSRLVVHIKHKKDN